MKETPSNNIDSLSYAERLAAKKLIKQQLQREGLPTAFQLQRFTSLSKNGALFSWKATIKTIGGRKVLEGTYN